MAGEPGSGLESTFWADKKFTHVGETEGQSLAKDFVKGFFNIETANKTFRPILVAPFEHYGCEKNVEGLKKLVAMEQTDYPKSVATLCALSFYTGLIAVVANFCAAVFMGYVDIVSLIVAPVFCFLNSYGMWFMIFKYKGQCLCCVACCYKSPMLMHVMAFFFMLSALGPIGTVLGVGTALSAGLLFTVAWVFMVVGSVASAIVPVVLARQMYAWGKLETKKDPLKEGLKQSDF